MQEKSEVAAARLRTVADAMFVLSMSERHNDKSLKNATEVLKSATLHNCLHVVRGQSKIPYAVVFVAALSADDSRKYEQGELNAFNVKSWVTGRLPVVLDVVSIDASKDAELEEQAQIALSRLRKPVVT
ncbi:MAG: hypothetical protein ABJL99_10725 [Aliishimia sp.]